MAGNFDDIIKQVLAQYVAPNSDTNPYADEPDVPAESAELRDYPKSTAKVPPDSMRDTPFYQDIPPITGNERDTRVFSDKEWRQELLYKQMEQAQQLYGIVPDDERRQNYTNAAGSYDLSRLDPTLPWNMQTQRMEKEGKQAPIDANVMMKAIENRQRLGRK